MSLGSKDHLLLENVPPNTVLRKMGEDGPPNASAQDHRDVNRIDTAQVPGK